MSLLPIDLQTMFSQMSQVGKEQAQAQQAAPAAQAQAASEVVRETAVRDNSVNATNEVAEGPDSVKNDESGEGQGRQGSRGRPALHEEASQEEREVFTDPDLGHHVDISG